MMNKIFVPPAIFLPALVVWLIFSSVSTVFDEENIKETNIMQEQAVKLPDPDLKGEVSTEEALSERRSVRSYQDEPLELKWVGQLLWAAQGITLESRGFRTAPSAGATYPLEVYVAAGRVDGLQPGLYKYIPGEHSLINVADGDIRNELASAALGQDHVRSAPAVFIMAADYDRTAGRYGERAPRYVHMEVGHASQNICLQAITYGLGTVIVGAFNDDQLKSVLGLPDNEDPLNLIPVGKPD
ncbi:MAG: SagB/ThcOx family dehydrogenase [Bacteroidales bacterium]